MNERPLVSVIIPAYNVEKYIARGINSVLSQTYSNIELIIVDDGSTDNTYYEMEKFLFDDRLRLLCQKNSGVSVARNNALKNAKGDYVVFLDSDDWLEENTIHALLDLQVRYKDSFICCDRYFAYEGFDGTITKERQRNSEKEVVVEQKKALMSFALGTYNLQSSCYKLFNRRIIESNNIEFNRLISHGEDGLFVYNYLKYCKTILFSTEPYWNILERKGSATTAGYNHKWLSIIESINQMKMLYPNDEDIKKALNCYLVDRLVLIENKIIISNEYSDDFKFVNEKLRIVSRTEKIYKTQVTKGITLFCYKYLDYNMLRFILSVRNRIRK